MLKTRATGFFLAVTLSAGAALADGSSGWLGFYRPTVTATPAVSAPAGAGGCVKEILEAQVRYDIPDNLLLAIGLQEAGRRMDGEITIWPWTANARGKGVFFNTKEDLEAWVQQTQHYDTQSVDVGCMQVNQKWHGHQFASLEEATDPRANVDYAARFLLGLYGETRDWWQAAGRYHSSTESYKAIYLDKLSQNQQLANLYLSTFTEQAAGYVRQASADDQAPWYAPTVNWTSDMTGNAQNTQDVMSIYSTSPLQAALPAYAQAE